jgi:hypothetical protein
MLSLPDSPRSVNWVVTPPLRGLVFNLPSPRAPTVLPLAFDDGPLHIRRNGQSKGVEYRWPYVHQVTGSHPAAFVLHLRTGQNKHPTLSVVGIIWAGVILKCVNVPMSKTAYRTPGQVTKIDNQVRRYVAHLPVNLLRLEAPQQVSLRAKRSNPLPT